MDVAAIALVCVGTHRKVRVNSLSHFIPVSPDGFDVSSCSAHSRSVWHLQGFVEKGFVLPGDVVTCESKNCQHLQVESFKAIQKAKAKSSGESKSVATPQSKPKSNSKPKTESKSAFVSPFATLQSLSADQIASGSVSTIKSKHPYTVTIKAVVAYVEQYPVLKTAKLHRIAWWMRKETQVMKDTRPGHTATYNAAEVYRRSQSLGLFVGHDFSAAFDALYEDCQRAAAEVAIASTEGEPGVVDGPDAVPLA
jgi:hypothetical protein